MAIHRLSHVARTLMAACPALKLFLWSYIHCRTLPRRVTLRLDLTMNRQLIYFSIIFQHFSIVVCVGCAT
ncbi:hypothetical protein BKA63DRAFT_511650 [Paraphoma chrysanthemicola]|nr:hypothetical protein BKA63DRAFT_511650 [Paraphoma chrysanthemicola]